MPSNKTTSLIIFAPKDTVNQSSEGWVKIDTINEKLS